MIIVADSGSTKADWLIYDNGVVLGPFATMGFNPLFHDSDRVFTELSSNVELKSFQQKEGEIHFFGAGCSSASMNAVIEAGLKRFFPNTTVQVQHDLLASALATCGKEPGIACILGTGSNSCWFDGQNVHERNYGLGYVLGDEGSGSYFGKKLLTLFLYGRMPQELSDDFASRYGLNKDLIIDHVYKQAHANVWLASFTRFLTAHAEHEWIRELVRKGLDDFAELFICDYPLYREVPVHFVGSLSFLFREQLNEVAFQRGFQIGKVIKQPIEELMNFFIRSENA